MVTLGISTNTRLLGLAIINRGVLLDYSIHLHKSPWSPSKANLIVTKLDIRWNDAGTGTAIQVACPKLCADLTQSCWPTVKVRELVVTIQGKSASDDTIKRSITTRVRLRNDLVNFNAPATQVCP